MEQIRDQQRLQQVCHQAGNKLVVVIFMDKNCGHCKRAMPEMEKLAQQYTLVIFVRIDVRETPEFVSNFNITAVPTFCFIKNESVADRITGADKLTVEKRIQDLSN
ncbi:uncharacterized protein [Pyxicephalus adspersus]|uniref:uncharacterized protein isoform X2 n=1 Tax=Pyxicephalus adspersus TaxID=30357 RepID=UPI003B590317